MKSVKIIDIRIDGGTQQRVEINDTIVSEYAEAMKCGAKFNPVTVFFDGAQYWLADGFHRYHASKIAAFNDILADVKDGTKREAVLYSASANGTHGIRLTNADKRKSVLMLLNDPEWGNWPDNKIAKHCHVTHPFVGKLRAEKIGTVKVKYQHVTVTETSPEAAPVLEVENGNLPKIAESTDENEYTETDQLKESLEVLREENARLSDRLAISVIEVTEEEAGLVEATIKELREENRVLKLSLGAVTKSRDSLMIENNELKKQCLYMQKQIKKAK